MSKKTSVLILENLRSVENTASIFRSADAFKVSKIFLIDTTPTPLDRFGRKRQDFAKISLGAEETVEWEHRKDIVSVIKELQETNFQIIALEQDPRAKRLRDFKSATQFALIVGNEVEGVSQEALNLAEAIVEIPMEGMKESLNVSVATGVGLFVLS